MERKVSHNLPCIIKTTLESHAPSAKGDTEPYHHLPAWPRSQLSEPWLPDYKMGLVIEAFTLEALLRVKEHYACEFTGLYLDHSQQLINDYIIIIIRN